MLPTRRSNRSTSALRAIPEWRWDVDRVFDEVFNRPAFSLTSTGPDADFYETDEEFVLEMDLPGYRLDDLDVSVEQGVLSVSGQRSEREELPGTFHLRERRWGRFARSFSVPHTIDANEVNAEFDNGVLRVRMPKAAEAKARRVEIRGAS